MTLLFAAITSFCAVYSGAVTLNAPKKFLILSGIGGSLCWATYVLLAPLTNEVLATFISSIVVAVYSNIMARVHKTPVTVFFIPAFLPTVPGISIYKSVYFYLNGNTEQFNFFLSQTLQVATVIALSIIIVDGLFKTGTRIKHLIKKRNTTFK